MENRRVLKKEGLNLTIDKEVLDDQRVLEVSTEVPDKAKVEKEDKDDFENYKVLYKGAIDDRCLEEYGTCDDEKLWEDTAKEMFLKAVNYIPEEDKKADGELVDREKEQEPTLVKENRSVIKHTKVVESKKLNEDYQDDIKESLEQAAGELAEKVGGEVYEITKADNPTAYIRTPHFGDIEMTFSQQANYYDILIPETWVNGTIDQLSKVLNVSLLDVKFETKECPKQD